MKSTMPLHAARRTSKKELQEAQDGFCHDYSSCQCRFLMKKRRQIDGYRTKGLKQRKALGSIARNMSIVKHTIQKSRRMVRELEREYRREAHKLSRFIQEITRETLFCIAVA